MIPAERLELPVTGKVLQPFPFRIEFPMQEGWEFATDVITSDDATEQRVADRDPARPRRLLRGVVHAFEAAEAAALQALLFGWNALPLGVPLWYDVMRLAEATAVDDEALTVFDAAGRDLAERLAAGLDVPVLLWKAHDDWEPALLASIDGAELTLTAPIARVWPAGTILLPLRLMAVADTIELEAPARAIRAVELEFIEAGVPAGDATRCSGATDADYASLRVQMVRPLTVTMGPDPDLPNAGLATPSHDTNYANSLTCGMPLSSDPPEEWTLFGFTRGIIIEPFPVYLTVVPQPFHGVASGLARCTTAASAALLEKVVGVGVAAYPAGTPALSMFGPIAGLAEKEAYFNVAAVFSGTGYAPAPGTPPTERHVSAAVGSLLYGMAQLTRTLDTGGLPPHGDEVTEFGLYDAGAPGGVAWTDVYLNSDANTTVVEFKHGYWVRARNFGTAYKGLKIVVEDVVDSTLPFAEWTYGTPEVTTRDFTGDEITAEVAFVKALAGGSTLFGNVHPAQSYVDAIGDEMARVTVSLYDADDVDTLQWMDHFKPMFAEMEVVA